MNSYTHRESDESLRDRITKKYGMWGAFLTEVLESSGEALDACAKHVGLERIVVEVPATHPQEF